MSLLLDALDRAERSRREQRALGQPDLQLEPRDGDGVALPAGNGAGDGSALFELSPGTDEPSRFWRGLAMVLALLAALAAAAWLYLGSWASGSGHGNGPAPAVIPAVQHHAGDHLPPTRSVTNLPAESARTGTPTGQPATGTHDRVALAGAGANFATGPTAAATTGPRPTRLAHHLPAAVDPDQAREAAHTAVAHTSGTDPSATVRSAPTVDIHLFRSSPVGAADPALRAAWSALRDGRLEEARQGYERLEQQLPGNVDVQLGLGRLAAERGEPDEARRHYQRALVLDPHDPSAQASLAMLQPPSSNPAVDSPLRQQVASKDADAQFALAARLSAGGQWPEAEQAWFEALRGHPDEPDVLFNLAVALDHLGQATAARDHYRQAVQAARTHPAHFSQTQVEQRLRALGGG
jgi:tetratricopeptide (TPR) repeat protein